MTISREAQLNLNILVDLGEGIKSLDALKAGIVGLDTALQKTKKGFDDLKQNVKPLDSQTNQTATSQKNYRRETEDAKALLGTLESIKKAHSAIHEVLPSRYLRAETERAGHLLDTLREIDAVQQKISGGGQQGGPSGQSQPGKAPAPVSIFSKAARYLGGILHMHDGGIVPGHGDRAAILEGGEAVIPRRAVQHFSDGGSSDTLSMLPKRRAVNPKKLYDEIRLSGARSPSEADHRRMLLDALRESEAPRFIPAGSKFIGSGVAALAFRSPENDVFRVQPHLGKRPFSHENINPSVFSYARPKIEPMLQNLASIIVDAGGDPTLIEKLPYAPSLHSQGIRFSASDDTSHQQIIRAQLKQAGYSYTDLHSGNVGLLGGVPKILDPGSLRINERPHFATGGATELTGTSLYGNQGTSGGIAEAFAFGKSLRGKSAREIAEAHALHKFSISNAHRNIGPTNILDAPWYDEERDATTIGAHGATGGISHFAEGGIDDVMRRLMSGEASAASKRRAAAASSLLPAPRRWRSSGA